MPNISLDYFIAIARTKSMTQAAAELFTTQQNLSAYLKRLEETYGLPVFVRRPRMELTPFGEELFRYALQIQASYERIKQAAAAYRSVCELHLGCRSSYPTDFSDWLPLGRFQHEHPNVRLIFHEFSNSEWLQKLTDRQVDFAFARFQSATLTGNGNIRGAIIANRSSYVLISRALLEAYVKNDLEEKIVRWKNGIALRELKPIPYFRLSKTKIYKNRSLEEEYLKEHDLEQFQLGECFSRAGALQMCRQGICYFVSGDPEPESDDFYSFPVVEPDTGYQLYCLCNTAVLSTSYGRDFWDMVLAVSQRTASSEP